MNWWVFGGFVVRGLILGNPLLGAANGAIAGGLAHAWQKGQRRRNRRHT